MSIVPIRGGWVTMLMPPRQSSLHALGRGAKRMQIQRPPAAIEKRGDRWLPGMMGTTGGSAAATASPFIRSDRAVRYREFTVRTGQWLDVGQKLSGRA